MPTLFEWILIAIGGMKHSCWVDSYSCLDCGVDVFVCIHFLVFTIPFMSFRSASSHGLDGNDVSIPSAVISQMSPFQMFQKYIPVVCVFVIPVSVCFSLVRPSQFVGLIVHPQTVTLFSLSKIILTTFSSHFLSLVVIGIFLGGS